MPNANKPDIKFPLRANYEDIEDADRRLICWIGSNRPYEFDDSMAAELVRLANLAHEAEAALKLQNPNEATSAKDAQK